MDNFKTENRALIRAESLGHLNNFIRCQTFWLSATMQAPISFLILISISWVGVSNLQTASQQAREFDTLLKLFIHSSAEIISGFEFECGDIVVMRIFPHYLLFVSFPLFFFVPQLPMSISFSGILPSWLLTFSPREQDKTTRFGCTIAQSWPPKILG